MKLLKISAVFVSLFFFALNLSAQRARGPMMNLDSMKVKLGLNAQQEKQVKAIIENYKPKLKSARESNTEQAARRAAMAPLVQAMQEEIRGVLKEEQKMKLDAMKANRAGRGKRAPQPK